MARRRKSRGISPATVFVVLIAVCLVGFVGYMVLSNLIQRTAVIEAGNLGNQYRAQAVVVRAETIVDTEGLSNISYFADEGQMVYSGDKIAEVYSTGYSQSDINKLLSIRSDIKGQLKTALSSDYGDANLERLDNQVLDYAKEISMLVNHQETGNLLNLERQLNAAIGQRQTYLRNKFYNTQPTLANLYDSETTLVKKIQSWTTPYLATENCIVSFYTDGYETILTADNVENISLPVANGVIAGEDPDLSSAQRGRTAVFRKVDPSRWYLVLVSKEKDWTPVSGQTYKIQLDGFEDTVIDGTVTTFSQSGNETLVRMQVVGDVRQVLNVRTVGATVGEHYVSGLKVPINAIVRQDGQEGIVRTDNGGQFVPVSIIMQDSKYAVVQSNIPGALWEGQKIRVF